jgi:hypothetical protein
MDYKDNQDASQNIPLYSSDQELLDLENEIKRFEQQLYNEGILISCGIE